MSATSHWEDLAPGIKCDTNSSTQAAGNILQCRILPEDLRKLRRNPLKSNEHHQKVLTTSVGIGVPASVGAGIGLAAVVPSAIRWFTRFFV